MGIYPKCGQSKEILQTGSCKALSKESKTIKKNDKNSLCMDPFIIDDKNDKKNVNEEESYPLRKLEPENFIISDKNDEGVVEKNNDNTDFSQYKHKKIRRISKDSEQKDNMKKSYDTVEQYENINENGTKHDKIITQTTNKELEKEIKHIEKKQKNKKDKNKK